MRLRTAGLSFLLLAGACSNDAADPLVSTSSSTVTSTIATTTTALPSRVVSLAPIEAPEGSLAWNVSYASETIGGEPTTVTGWVAIPSGGDDGMPVLAWAHPTVGLADECAPSARGGLTPFSFQPELGSGWAVVATDYEGLGGPGLHPYLVSESEARSIFDLVRAAQEIDHRVGDHLALWGFSQGGHAVLSAAGLAPSLAPDLEVIGTVAIAPAVDLIGWPPVALGTPQQGYIAAIAVAYAAAYGLDRDEILEPLSPRLVAEIETACGDFTWTGAALVPPALVFSASPDEVEPWASLLRDNSPEFTHIEAPVLLVIGEEDDLFTTDLLPLIVDRMCAVGTPVATRTYEGFGHVEVQTPAEADIRLFIQDRVEGRAFTSDC